MCLFLRKIANCFLGGKVHYLSVWVQIVTDPLHIWLLKGSEQAYGGFSVCENMGNAI